jgi:hypothetical protein
MSGNTSSEEEDVTQVEIIVVEDDDIIDGSKLGFIFLAIAQNQSRL